MEEIITPPATPSYFPASQLPVVQDPEPKARKCLASQSGVKIEEPSSDSESGSESSSSSSSSSSEEERSSSKKKRSRDKKHSRSASPETKKQRKDKLSTDAKLVQSQPFILFIKNRITPKACGKCEECKKPPCGKCKICKKNASIDAAVASGVKLSDKEKEHHRCEALRCIKDVEWEAATPLPPGIPEDLDKLSAEASTLSSKLAEMSTHRGQPDFQQKNYDAMMERMNLLCEGVKIIKNRRARRRAKFPIGFHDVWSVISSIESDRLKFAKFIVRTAASEDSRTTEIKKHLRDGLDTMLTQLAHNYAATLAPVGEEQAFAAALAKSRQ